MTNNQAFSIRIFVPDGDPDGLRMVERSNWIGKALVFPRSLVPEIKRREEFSQTGVYVLIGPREDGEGEAIYIGEGDPVLPRIESHYANKDFLDPSRVLRHHRHGTEQGAGPISGIAASHAGQGSQARKAGQPEPVESAFAPRGRYS